jgi:hypothetical protein
MANNILVPPATTRSSRDDGIRRVDAPTSSVGDVLVPLLVDPVRPVETARHLAAILGRSPCLFDRNGPVRLVTSQRGLEVKALNKNAVTIAAHEVCRPVQEEFVEGVRQLNDVALPDKIASLYLDLVGEWQLRPLNGFCYGPMLFDNGQFELQEGYDKTSGLWCTQTLIGKVPAAPSRSDAQAALQTLREILKTFPFADAAMRSDDGQTLVDLSIPPRFDETVVLVALMTAVCRASLPSSPGVLIRGAQFSGSGLGKGLLARAISLIAFGSEPEAFTVGHTKKELEHRLAAMLFRAVPMMFIDNANSITLNSDLLAQALTEPNIATRKLHTFEMVPMPTKTFLLVTGNDVRLGEDCARRVIVAELDARSENPEHRKFCPGFLTNVKARRPELLAAVLIIWRWGRLNSLGQGQSLGSFEQWGYWCRDPFLALGCADPVARLSQMKTEDPTRDMAVELLRTWYECHGAIGLCESQVDGQVREIIGRDVSRQRFVEYLNRLKNSEIGGLRLSVTRTGKWSKAVYRVTETGDC